MTVENQHPDDGESDARAATEAQQFLESLDTTAENAHYDLMQNLQLLDAWIDRREADVPLTGPEIEETLSVVVHSTRSSIIAVLRLIDTHGLADAPPRDG